MGVEDVYNISGGFISLQRQAYAVGFQNIHVNLPELENKKINEGKGEKVADNIKETSISANLNTPLVIDVRTPVEFMGGAYPNAINISLDELERRVNELGDKDREITLYCASGARSAYAQQMLIQMGFTNVENGGGLMNMMRRK
jgi:rhodanese-related sulfurtransferase